MTVPIPHPETRPRHPWFADAVFNLDRYLRRRNGVIEYSHHPACIFRIARATLERRLVLEDGAVLDEGAPILELHLWSEQVPVFPPGGATLVWARRMAGCLDISLRELARYLAREPGSGDIAAIRADMTFSTSDRTAQVLRVCRRFGFAAVANRRAPGRGQRLHRLGENILIGLMILGRNPGAFRLDSLRRDRTEVALTRGRLDGRYAGGAGARP